MPLVLRRLTEEDWTGWRDLRLAALAEAPYAFSATLADWTGSGDREERWRNRLVEVPCNLIAELDGDGAGMASCSAPVDGEAVLMSMWVAPEARGQGVGRALVEEICRWAASEGAHTVALGVRPANAPAVSFYIRAGFKDVRPSSGITPETPSERKMVRRLGLV